MSKDFAYLILGIGTDIGKTYLVELLCKNVNNSMAIKPIVTGFKQNGNSDSERILKAMKLKISKDNIKKISPWRYENPVSPHYVDNINYQALKKFCIKNINQAKKDKKYLFIESSGGVMTPINNQKTFLDLAIDLKIPILLVTSDYLGSISHTLSAFLALKISKIKIKKIIINNFKINNKIFNFENSIKNFTKLSVEDLQYFVSNFPK